jgi:hypothetical protein
MKKNSNEAVTIFLILTQLCLLQSYSIKSGELTVDSFNLKWTDEQNEIEFEISCNMNVANDFYLAIGFSNDQQMVILNSF